MKIQHYDMESWLDEMGSVLASEAVSTLAIRICRVPERRDTGETDIYVIGGFFDEDNLLVELTMQMDSPDHASYGLRDGTQDATGVILEAKRLIYGIAAQTGKSVSVRGGRFQLM